MPLEKITNPEEYCTAHDHCPPSHAYLEPGTYKNTCSGCGKVTFFTVPKITCGATYTKNGGRSLDVTWHEKQVRVKPIVPHHETPPMAAVPDAPVHDWGAEYNRVCAARGY